ncbi:MAG: nucleotidyltransferase family protein [Eubacteriales bacterium]|nr:nucleotidyltransferase family protein [Eubacteriales bacterium]
MKTDEKLLLQAILDHDDQVSKACFERWAEMTDLDNIEGGSYRLIPALYRRMSRINGNFTYQNRMKGIYRYFLYRNSMTLHKTKEILLVLNENQIPYVVLKGGALLASYYEDKGIRPMNDLDILVDEAFISRTIELLRSSGWQPQDEESLSVNHHAGHAITFLNADGMELDLHWHVIYQCCWDGADSSYWTHTEKASLAGVDISILNPTLQLFHTCAHGLRWNELSSIRWVADAMSIIEKRERDIDWTVFLQETRSKKLTYTIKKAVDILRNDFGAQIPDSLLVELDKIPVSDIERRLHDVLSGTSKYKYVKIRWYIYSLGMIDKSLIKRIIGLPSYLQAVWNLKSRKEILPAIITKVKAKKAIQ